MKVALMMQWKKYLKLSINRLVDFTLGSRKREMLKYKLGFYGAPMSLQAIADMQNPPRSSERCRQILAQSNRKLKSNSEVVDSLRQLIS